MARLRIIITGLVVAIVTLLAMRVAVAQSPPSTVAPSQETPLTDAQDYLDRGVAYYDKADNDRAIADFTQALKLDPKYALAYRNRAFAYRASGDDDRAIADFTEVINLDPKDAIAFIDRGLLYRKRREHGRASADFIQAVRLDPKTAQWYGVTGMIDPKSAREAGVDQTLSALKQESENKPGVFRLDRAYYFYSLIQMCHQKWPAYVNDDALQRARTAAKAIEKTALEKYPTIDPATVWAEADRRLRSSFSRNPYLYPEVCQESLAEFLPEPLLAPALKPADAGPIQTHRP